MGLCAWESGFNQEENEPREGEMPSPRSGVQAIRCGRLGLGTRNSSLGAEGSRGREGGQRSQGVGGWLQEEVVVGCIKSSMAVEQMSPKLSGLKQQTFVISVSMHSLAQLSHELASRQAARAVV